MNAQASSTQPSPKKSGRARLAIFGVWFWRFICWGILLGLVVGIGFIIWFTWRGNPVPETLWHLPEPTD